MGKANTNQGTAADHLSASQAHHYHEAAQAVRAAILARLRDDGLNHHDVRCRVKDQKSILEKLARRDHEGHLKYPRGAAGLDDLVGIRVILFVETDIEAVATALTSQFICHEDDDKTAFRRKNGEIGYAGRHLILEVPGEHAPMGCEKFSSQRFEVQIRTILQHAWAEFEHDIRYKGTLGRNGEIDRAFTMASTLIELADQQFANINDILKRLQAESSAPAPEEMTVLDRSSLQAMLDRAFHANPRSKAAQYNWLIDCLAASGATTVSSAEALFENSDDAELPRRMGYRFPAGQVRIADDYLLHKLGEAYIEATSGIGEDAGRESKLKYRLRKLRAH